MMKFLTLLLIFSLSLGNFSCKRESKREETKEKINSPPTITSVVILCDKPTKDNDLSLLIKSQDIDGDPITYSYQWIKNDKEIVGENRAVLLKRNFRKGDIIQVRITPSDGKITGRPFLSPPLKIINSPPIIEEIQIEPKMATSKDSLRVFVKGYDEDGDFIYYTFTWEKNGIKLPEERKDFLESGKFKKGDKIIVTVTPDDRESLGITKRSETITILNSPPLITSSPPIYIEGERYSYQVKVDDPDNDPVSFKLKSGPRGMEIQRETGLIQWEIKKEDVGEHLIEVEVSDNDGLKSQQKYTLTVSYKQIVK